MWHKKMRWLAGLLYIAVFTSVKADYVLFVALGSSFTGDTVLSLGYTACRSTIIGHYNYMPASGVFPFVYGATELSNWNDNGNVILPDGRVLFTASQFRTQSGSSIGNTISRFEGCLAAGCDNCWFQFAGVQWSQDSNIVFYSGMGSNFQEASGFTCGAWTSPTSWLQYSVLAWNPATCGFQTSTRTCNTGGYKYMCLWDTRVTFAPTPGPTKLPTPPTRAPTNVPTGSPTLPTPAPTKSPTLAPTPAPLTRSPTKAPTKSPTLPTSSPTRSPTGFITPQQEPIIDYSFSQKGCKEGRWDFEDGLSFTRMLNATSCFHDKEDGFQYWGSGAYNTRVDGKEYMDAFSSSVITNQLDSVASRIPGHDFKFSNLTFMIWMTRVQRWPLESYRYQFLMDIGPSAWQTEEVPATFSIQTNEGYWIRADVRYYEDSSYGIQVDSTNIFGGDWAANYPGYTYCPTIAILVRIKNKMGKGSDTRVSVFGWQGFDKNVTSYDDAWEYNDPIIGPLVLQDGSKFRFNTYRYMYPSTYSGTNGTVIHRVAMWNRYLIDEEVLEEARYGMPKSIASTRNWTLNIEQSQSLSFDLNTTDFVRDFDNDTVVSIRIHSLPLVGVLYVNEEAVTEGMLPLSYSSNSDALRYEANTLVWSSEDCESSAIKFDASDDGANYSLGDSYVRICIEETNYRPEVIPDTVHLPRGASVLFKVNATDLNDETIPPSWKYGLLNASSPNELRNTSTVLFISQVENFGGVYLDDCSTPITPDQEYHLSNVFCFVSNKDNDQQGLDGFGVAVSDAELFSQETQIKFNITNPLVAPESLVSTDEFPSIFSFQVPVYDGLEREGVVAQILSLPLNGTLRHMSNESLVGIGDLVSSNLTYEGDEYYFNRYSDGSSLNFYGEPLPPLDTIQYQVIHIESNTSSESGIILIAVRNVFNPIRSISGLRNEIVLTPSKPYLFGSDIQIDDPDDDEFAGAIRLSISNARVSVDVNESELIITGPNQNGLLLGSCGHRIRDGCETVYFAARPRYINHLLRKTRLYTTRNVSITTTLILEYFKPGPAGITTANFEETILAENYQIRAKIPVTINSTGTDQQGPTIGDSISFLLSFIIVCFVSALILICLFAMAIGYCCFATLSHFAATTSGIIGAILAMILFIPRKLVDCIRYCCGGRRHANKNRSARVDPNDTTKPKKRRFRV